MRCTVNPFEKFTIGNISKKFNQINPEIALSHQMPFPNHSLLSNYQFNIPCEATFSNFRARLGQNLYNDIFHVLVNIFHKLEMISFKILAHDGTLYLSEA